MFSLKNHHYSIFVASDNVDDAIMGFSELYFMVKEHNVICEHHFGLLSSEKQKVSINQTAILLSKNAIYESLKACLYLKNKDQRTPLDLCFEDKAGGSFSLSFSF